MAHAITLNRDILNQTGVPVRVIISEADGDPKCDGEFYSFGDIIIRVSLVDAIVKMADTPYKVVEPTMLCEARNG